MLGRLLPPLMLVTASVASAAELDSGRAAFSMRVRSELVPYRVQGIFVVPGEKVALEIHDRRPEDVYRVAVGSGALVAKGRGAWSWTAPMEPGLHRLVVLRERDSEKMTFNVFVKVPLREPPAGRLNGYRIGSYPKRPLRGLAIYRPPSGLIEVTADNVDTPVSPHFTLGQFLCKQAGGFPKYVALEERLLLALELILERASEKGWASSGLHVMSGYRTPFYNEAIGNVPYSRHVWGGAADIFIDERPRDGFMDDLDGDGKTGLDDASVLFDFIDGLFGRPIHERFFGGLGRYDATPAHGPFVHVDVRGTRARWGR